ncbi:MAG: hypothetical protein SFU91_15065 [Chloroherpetonaceae bacterium]|nr:hypothetical protein [Chloroherpetonaceae bacterium]
MIELVEINPMVVVLTVVSTLQPLHFVRAEILRFLASLEMTWLLYVANDSVVSTSRGHLNSSRAGMKYYCLDFSYVNPFAYSK